MQKFSVILYLFCASLFITACGQTGPLYLPGQKPPIYVPHPKKIHTEQQPQPQPQQQSQPQQP